MICERKIVWLSITVSLSFLSPCTLYFAMMSPTVMDNSPINHLVCLLQIAPRKSKSLWSMRHVISAFPFIFLNASCLPAPVGIGCLVLVSLEESFESLVCQTWELTLCCHPEQNPIKINSPMKVTAAWCPSSTGNNFCLPSVKSFSPLLVLCYYLLSFSAREVMFLVAIACQ